MNDKDRLQAEAVSRAKEMYRRSQSVGLNSLPNGYKGNIRENRQPPKNENSEKADDEKKENFNFDDKSGAETKDCTENTSFQNESVQCSDPLENFLQDKEKALIVLLIALLSEERANTSLVLALMYLIM